MQKLKKNTVFFSVGAIGYGLIEILWRGHTHWAMLIAGGICFMIFSTIAKDFGHMPLFFKACLCAVAVTTVEIIFGFLFNMVLGIKIWDYSNQPYNFMGQICLFYSFLWGVLGFIFIPLADYINKKFLWKRPSEGLTKHMSFQDSAMSVLDLKSVGNERKWNKNEKKS